MNKTILDSESRESWCVHHLCRKEQSHRSPASHLKQGTTHLWNEYSGNKLYTLGKQCVFSRKNYKVLVGTQCPGAMHRPSAATCRQAICWNGHLVLFCKVLSLTSITETEQTSRNKMLIVILTCSRQRGLVPFLKLNMDNYAINASAFLAL